MEQQAGSEQQGDGLKQLQNHGWRGSGSLLGFKNTNGYTVELLMGENIVVFLIFHCQVYKSKAPTVEKATNESDHKTNSV